MNSRQSTHLPVALRTASRRFDRWRSRQPATPNSKRPGKRGEPPPWPRPTKEIERIEIYKDLAENDSHTLRRSRWQALARRRPRRRCVAAGLPGRRLQDQRGEPGAFLKSTREGPWRALEGNCPFASVRIQRPARAP